MRVEEVLLRQHSLGTSQQETCAIYREGYMDSSSALMSRRLASVGILWTRNLDHHPLICRSIGLQALIVAESIGRKDAYIDAMVVGLVVSTSLLLLLICTRMKGSRSMSAEVLTVWLNLLRAYALSCFRYPSSLMVVLQVMITSLSI
jgi:hypothetical protein